MAITATRVSLVSRFRGPPIFPRKPRSPEQASNGKESVGSTKCSIDSNHTCSIVMSSINESTNKLAYSRHLLFDGRLPCNTAKHIRAPPKSD